jgi:hypothetical protein
MRSAVVAVAVLVAVASAAAATAVTADSVYSERPWSFVCAADTPVCYATWRGAGGVFRVETRAGDTAEAGTLRVRRLNTGVARRGDCAGLAVLRDADNHNRLTLYVAHRLQNIVTRLVLSDSGDAVLESRTMLTSIVHPEALAFNAELTRVCVSSDVALNDSHSAVRCYRVERTLGVDGAPTPSEWWYPVGYYHYSDTHTPQQLDSVALDAHNAPLEGTAGSLWVDRASLSATATSGGGGEYRELLRFPLTSDASAPVSSFPLRYAAVDPRYAEQAEHIVFADALCAVVANYDDSQMPSAVAVQWSDLTHQPFASDVRITRSVLGELLYRRVSLWLAARLDALRLLQISRGSSGADVAFDRRLEAQALGAAVASLSNTPSASPSVSASLPVASESHSPVSTISSSSASESPQQQSVSISSSASAAPTHSTVLDVSAAPATLPPPPLPDTPQQSDSATETGGGGDDPVTLPAVGATLAALLVLLCAGAVVALALIATRTEHGRQAREQLANAVHNAHLYWLGLLPTPSGTQVRSASSVLSLPLVGPADDSADAAALIGSSDRDGSRSIAVIGRRSRLSDPYTSAR